MVWPSGVDRRSSKLLGAEDTRCKPLSTGLRYSGSRPGSAALSLFYNLQKTSVMPDGCCLSTDGRNSGSCFTSIWQLLMFLRPEVIFISFIDTRQYLATFTPPNARPYLYELHCQKVSTLSQLPHFTTITHTTICLRRHAPNARDRAVAEAAMLAVEDNVAAVLLLRGGDEVAVSGLRLAGDRAFGGSDLGEGLADSLELGLDGGGSGEEGEKGEEFHVESGGGGARGGKMDLERDEPDR